MRRWLRELLLLFPRRWKSSCRGGGNARGLSGASKTWMFSKRLHGWIHAVPRKSPRASTAPARSEDARRLFEVVVHLGPRRREEVALDVVDAAGEQERHRSRVLDEFRDAADPHRLRLVRDLAD